MVDHPGLDANGSVFVTTEWLASRIADPDIVVIDGSWYLPTQNRDGKAEFAEGHIPGAVFFDIDSIADQTSGLPHMLLDEASFAKQAGELGVPSDKTLVVYDGSGLFSAPRVWWTLRLFGAKEVLILQGGFPKWKAEGRQVESGSARRQPTQFTARKKDGAVAELEAVRQALDSGKAQVVDARPAPRFKGEAPEPRPGVRAGHMPGSYNLPFTEVIADGELKSPKALREVFDRSGIDLDQPVIASCGSGVSAAILVLAMETMGRHDTTLYDGSWAEYGSRNDLPIAKGD
jgi:thiosulfate/3-mercaptopyruvate sulfurtransferase